MMPRLAALALALLLAGCASTSSSSSDRSFSMSTTLAHDFGEGATRESTFGVSAPGIITYDGVFTARDVGGTMVCPMDGTDAKAEFVSPSGRVAAVLAPDVRGVTGGGQCGTGEGTLEAAQEDVGDWTVRFSGTGDVSVRIDIAARSR